MNALNESEIRELLATLRAVLDSPEARDPVDAVKTKSKKGYTIGRQRLADARRWIDDVDRQLRDAGGDETRLLSLLGEVERVSGFVMYEGDQRDIKLAGEGPGIVAWRVIKQSCRTYRHFTGPDWLSESGPYWPRWTVPASADRAA